MPTSPTRSICILHWLLQHLSYWRAPTRRRQMLFLSRSREDGKGLYLMLLKFFIRFAQSWSGAVVTLSTMVLGVACASFAPSITPTLPLVASPTDAMPTAGSTPVLKSMPPLTAGLGIGSTKLAADGSLMMYVPAGEFPMGSTDDDKAAFKNERPQHTVYLDAFWIGKYEVTNMLYKKCVAAGRCTAPYRDYWPNGSFPSGKENHPITGITWEDAVTYAEWAAARLPTDAEWEKAMCWDAENQVKRVYPWGNEFDSQKANTWQSGFKSTTAVGRYSPKGDSPYGISDMAGNVFEWIADWYDLNYYKSSPRQNPQGPSSGRDRVLRGGSWLYNPDRVRCAYREWQIPTVRTNDIGFRIAESVSP